MQKSKKIDISKTLEEKIAQEEITMRPQWHFVLASFLLGFGTIGVLSSTIFTLSLFFFHWRMHEILEQVVPERLLWATMLRNIPWLYLLVSIALFYISLSLLKKYEFSYKKNWPLLLLGLLIAIIFSSFFVDRIGVNDRLRRHPALRHMYEVRYQIRSTPRPRLLK